MTEQRPIGIVGLGLLGGALAERLLAAGYAVTGWDIDPQRRAEHTRRGGLVTKSAQDVFSSGPRVLLSLPTSDVVAQVLRECDAVLWRGLTIIDTTTGEPDSTAALGGALAATSSVKGFSSGGSSVPVTTSRTGAPLSSAASSSATKRFASSAVNTPRATRSWNSAAM